ncbi:MAG: hypothetical protein WCA20_16585 [Candidatus Sulfotelmatobacter sp.]
MEFAAVGAARVGFVASEAIGTRIARAPFAGNVAIGKSGFVFPGVDPTLNLNDEGAAKGVTG